MSKNVHKVDVQCTSFIFWVKTLFFINSNIFRCRLGSWWWRIRWRGSSISILGGSRRRRSLSEEKIWRARRQTEARAHGLHLRAAGQPREQVQNDQVLVGLRTPKPCAQPQPNRNPGQNLVPKQENKMEETESRNGCQQWPITITGTRGARLYLSVFVSSRSSPARPLLSTSGLSLPRSCSSWPGPCSTQQLGQPVDASKQHVSYVSATIWFIGPSTITISTWISSP